MRRKEAALAAVEMITAELTNVAARNININMENLPGYIKAKLCAELSLGYHQ